MNHLVVNIVYALFIITFLIGAVKIVRNASKIKAYNKVIKARLRKKNAEMALTAENKMVSIPVNTSARIRV